MEDLYFIMYIQYNILINTKLRIDKQLYSDTIVLTILHNYVYKGE